MKPIKPDILTKRFLSDIKINELKNEDAEQLKEFVKTSDFEKTVTGKTKLSVIYEIWLAEKSRKKRGSETKKAEKILNAAATQTFWEMNRRIGYERDRRTEKRRAKWEILSSHEVMNPLKGLKKNLGKLGITRNETIGKILDGIKKVKKLSCEIDAIEELSKRVTMVLDSFKAHMDYARKVFSTQPKLLALPDRQFQSLVKSMKIEIKKIKPEGTM